MYMDDPRVNLASRDNRAIIKASRHGCHSVVELLLTDSRVDPTARDNSAVKAAAKYGQTSVVELCSGRPFRSGRLCD
jgi:hypothetical protein